MDLAGLIVERIAREGPITFESFMEAALYMPGFGYYASEDTDIGIHGDFYTSPHLHPAFGAMLGVQIEEFWTLLGRPRNFHIVEAGGGKGHLAKDILDSLKGKPVYDSLKYSLVELNPHMMEWQKSLLKDYSGIAGWSENLSGVGHSDAGCVISNELFDAMPVHLITIDSGPKEIYVSFKDNRFVETPGPLSTPLIGDYIDDFDIRLAEGYRTEVNLVMKDWLRDASGLFGEGFILTIDYGHSSRDYYNEERTRGTLLCYHKHRMNENPYENIGRQDITAHVNFTALKKWGEEMGLKPLGYCRQGPYLVSLGIGEKISGLRQGDPLELERLKNLFMPGTMGDSHKVMIQYKGSRRRPELQGYKLSNKLESL